MRAKLVFWQKARIEERYILELKIHEVGRSEKYPDGIRYGLICKDLVSDRQVLLDNHHPKGHHLHIDDRERAYDFKGIPVLLEDFEKLVESHLGVKL